MKKLLFAAALGLAAAGCESLNSARKPSSSPYVAEENRLYNGTVIAFDHDVSLQNEEISAKYVQVGGQSVVVETDGSKVFCAIAVEVKPRTIAVIKAGRRFEARWLTYGMVGSAVLALVDEGTQDQTLAAAKAIVSCQSLDKDGFASPYGNSYLGPMTLSLKYLESSLGAKILKKVDADQLRTEEIKYSPGDEKGKLLKELYL